MAAPPRGKSAAPPFRAPGRIEVSTATPDDLRHRDARDRIVEHGSTGRGIARTRRRRQRIPAARQGSVAEGVGGDVVEHPHTDRRGTKPAPRSSTPGQIGLCPRQDLVDADRRVRASASCAKRSVQPRIASATAVRLEPGRCSQVQHASARDPRRTRAAPARSRRLLSSPSASPRPRNCTSAVSTCTGQVVQRFSGKSGCVRRQPRRDRRSRFGRGEVAGRSR